MVIIIKNTSSSVSYEKILLNMYYHKEHSIWSQIDWGLNPWLCVFGQATSFKYSCPHPCHGITNPVCHMKYLRF